MNNRTFTQDLLGVQNDLLRFAYKLTSDREEANDLLQETSLKALDTEEKYTPDTNFKGWIYTIMRNIFINNYRKVVRDQTFVDTTDNLYHLNTPHNLPVKKRSPSRVTIERQQWMDNEKIWTMKPKDIYLQAVTLYILQLEDL